MRRAFSNALVEAAANDERVIFLTGDLGFNVFDEFIERFPRRYINVGVAEAQLVDCAAGLALEGWRPIVYSIASFMTGRAFEQIRVTVSYHGLPVVVIGAGGGYTYGDAGVTHHAVEDLGLMSLMPNMTVVAPCDPTEVTSLLPQLLRLDGPSYFRVGRFGEPVVEADAPIEIGVPRGLRQGTGVALVTVGAAAVQAVEAWDELAKVERAPFVLHTHTVKPFNEGIFDMLPSDIHTVIVIEEHCPTAGFAERLALRSAGGTAAFRVRRLGPDGGLVLGNPTQAEIRSRLNYDHTDIVSACLEAWDTGEDHEPGRVV